MKEDRIKELIVARPEGMNYDEYRMKRAAQCRQLKRRLSRGFMVWPSKGIFGVKDNFGSVIPVQSKGTLVGKVPVIKII